MQCYFPVAPLSKYIDCFWYVETQVPYTRERILPMPTIELMINFGAPHLTFDIHNRTHATVRKQGWVAGLHTHYILNQPLAETRILGVRFRPGGAYPFLRVPLVELRNQVVDLDLLWGADGERLRQRLAALPNLATRCRYLEQFLLKKLTDDIPHRGMIRQVTQELAAPSKSRSIRQISEIVGVSQKHLINRFKITVGLTPKQFARVTRLQTVLQRLDPAKAIDWGTLAHQCWYYDQAHFVHEFQRFAGLTPSAYLAQRRQIFGPELAQGEGIHFVPDG